MSNKTTLQSNNSTISTHNNELVDILNTINNLPSAGTGGTNDELYLALLTGTITEVVNSDITMLRAYSLYDCKQLTKVDVPNAKSTGGFACRNCTALVDVNIPQVSSLGGGTFYGCTSLPRIELGAVSNVPTNFAYGCTNLTVLIINKTSVVSLGGVNAFANTPIASGTGYIYVPDDLVDDYKAATNWSTYAAQIKPISELS